MGHCLLLAVTVRFLKTRRTQETVVLQLCMLAAGFSSLKSSFDNPWTIYLNKKI
jgi:hypothetical protein